MKTREDILSLDDCPFCGLEPMLLETREVGGSAQQFMIACYQCGIEMGSEDREDLVETWSRRAVPAPPAAEAPGQEPSADEIEQVKMAMRKAGREARGDDGMARAAILAMSRPAPPTYADAEAKGFERGIEAAAKWHDGRVKEADEYLRRLPKRLHGREENPEWIAWADTSINHTDHAAAIRSLACPAPKGET